MRADSAILHDGHGVPANRNLRQLAAVLFWTGL